MQSPAKTKILLSGRMTSSVVFSSKGSLMKISRVQILILALSAYPASGQAATYDGRWSVSVVTRSGNCDSYRWNLGITEGHVTDVEGQKGSSSGGIAPNGKVAITLARASDTLSVTGLARGAAASGSWSSPSRSCSGTWDARKE
jgi:hypothetical protein